MPLNIYIAASFRHLHGVRLLGKEFSRLGCNIFDWTAKAAPPPGLTPAERRLWMDTDRAGGEVYSFCRQACIAADLLVYYGASGQDAGVEVGLASAAGVPILGIRGPLEAPGLMLHGAVAAWVDSIEEAIAVVCSLTNIVAGLAEPDMPGIHPAAVAIYPLLRGRTKSGDHKNHIDANHADS